MLNHSSALIMRMKVHLPGTLAAQLIYILRKE